MWHLKQSIVQRPLLRGVTPIVQYCATSSVQVVSGWVGPALRMMSESRRRSRQEFEEGIDPSLGACDIRRKCCGCDEPLLLEDYNNVTCVLCGHEMHIYCTTSTFLSGGYYCTLCPFPDDTDADETDADSRSLVESARKSKKSPRVGCLREV